ncbi:MAG TPA: F0F1 ATP synthase subunit B' [Xanthobacteraceae bacterium]|jgi:F-type H+-transporting ATPase subunit b|nr:F0F1 ATP synthase subunit B' [Xanthobacteraceae bacterium]
MAEPAAHTEVPGGHKAPFPPFQGETFASQLVWLAITFVVLYALAAKIALPRVGGIFAARRERVESDVGEARRLREDADAALAAYEKALADAHSRGQSIASETHARLTAEGETRRKGLEAELNAKLAEAEKAIAATKQAAMANVRTIAAEAAAAIVERLIGAAPAEPAVAAAVDDALKR